MDADPGNVEGTVIAVSDIANRMMHCDDMRKDLESWN